MKYLFMKELTHRWIEIMERYTYVGISIKNSLIRSWSIMHERTLTESIFSYFVYLLQLGAIRVCKLFCVLRNS